MDAEESKSSDARKADVLSRIRTYDPPPKGFDPLTASEAALRRYGLPSRPDPEKQPHLAQMWDLAFSRPLTFVKAEVAVDPNLRRRPRKEGDFDGNNWAGVVRRPGGEGNDYTQPATMIFGQWVVPKVQPFDPAFFDPIKVGFWVGLDGTPEDKTGILQAGVAAVVKVHPSGTLSVSFDVGYYAWVEWFPDAPCLVQNFPVGEGDNVFFLVCAPQPDEGFVWMLNLSRSLAARVGLSPPPGYTSRGLAAEWIVEAASGSRYLPYFHLFTFSGCGAGSAEQFFDLLPYGDVIEIRDDDAGNHDFPGTPITNTRIVSPTSAIVQWLGFGKNLPT